MNTYRDLNIKIGNLKIEKMVGSLSCFTPFNISNAD